MKTKNTTPINNPTKLTRSFVALPVFIIIFTVGFLVGKKFDQTQTPDHRETSLRQLLETQGSNPEEVDATINYIRSGREGAKTEKRINLWLGMITPNALLAVSIFFQFFFAKRNATKVSTT